MKIKLDWFRLGIYLLKIKGVGGVLLLLLISSALHAGNIVRIPLDVELLNEMDYILTGSPAKKDVGVNSVFDMDLDGDGVAKAVDNCLKYNPFQFDSDHDGVGDACVNDADGDGIVNTADNCPLVKNPGQIDINNDYIGDACDFYLEDSEFYYRYALSYGILYIFEPDSNIVLAGINLSQYIPVVAKKTANERARYIEKNPEKENSFFADHNIDYIPIIPVDNNARLIPSKRGLYVIDHASDVVIDGEQAERGFVIVSNQSFFRASSSRIGTSLFFVSGGSAVIKVNQFLQWIEGYAGSDVMLSTDRYDDIGNFLLDTEVSSYEDEVIDERLPQYGDTYRGIKGLFVLSENGHYIGNDLDNLFVVKGQFSEIDCGAGNDVVAFPVTRAEADEAGGISYNRIKSIAKVRFKKYFVSRLKGCEQISFFDEAIDLKDIDSDGVLNEDDNCPDISNPYQRDSNGDGFGDVCDFDSDGDQVKDDVDVCPEIPDPDQVDSDNNGVGDVCESFQGEMNDYSYEWDDVLHGVRIFDGGDEDRVFPVGTEVFFSAKKYKGRGIPIVRVTSFSEKVLRVKEPAIIVINTGNSKKIKIVTKYDIAVVEGPLGGGHRLIRQGGKQ